MTQEVLNENKTAAEVYNLIDTFINSPPFDRKLKKSFGWRFRNKLIILAGHGEPGNGFFQVNHRKTGRLYMQDLHKIVNLRRLRDEGGKQIQITFVLDYCGGY